MATTVEQSELSILDKLLTEPKSFNFYQAIRLIGHLIKNEARKGEKGNLDIIPQLSLAFPQSDISDIKVDNDNHYTVIATFFSLYGTTSPLPTFYTEQLIQDDDSFDSLEVKCLLDIFHKRLYKLLFNAWSKSRIYEQFAEYEDENCIEAFYGFIGLAVKDIRQNIPDYAYLLRYASHWVSNSKSVWSLKNFLTDYFKVPFNVYSLFRAIQNIPEEQYCLLGQANYQLSRTAYLGSQFKSCSNSLLISIGPLSGDIFPDFLANTEKINRLKLLLQLYIKEPFSYFIEVILDKGCFKPIQLGGGATSILGVASWLSPQKEIDMFKIHYWLK